MKPRREIHANDSVSVRLQYIFHEVKNYHLEQGPGSLTELSKRLDEYLDFSTVPASRQAAPLLKALFSELGVNGRMNLYFPNEKYNEAMLLLSKWLDGGEEPDNSMFVPVLSLVGEAYIQSLQDAFLSCESNLVAEHVLSGVESS